MTNLNFRFYRVITVKKIMVKTVKTKGVKTPANLSMPL